MSKSKSVKQDTSAYTNYANYLKGVDTSNVDNTLSNFTQYASEASKNLADVLGNYSFSVNGSDEARQRAEQATFDNYMNYLEPQFAQERNDLETSLINKGLGVGSEAYERAIADYDNAKNQAINAAAYQAVLNGQNAFTQSLGDEVTAGQYGNAAQQNYINQLYSVLEGSPSGYENQQNIFSVDAAKSAIDYQNALAKAKGGLSGALSGALQGGVTGFLTTGNPYGALAGAGLGAYSGYTSNPYAANSGNNINWSSWADVLGKYKTNGSKKDAK